MKATGLVLDAERSVDVEPDEFYDLSRFGNNGVSTNAPTWVQLPSGLWVLNFIAASSQYITCGTPASLQISPRITVLAWVKGAVSGVTQSVLSKFDDNLQQRSWDLGSLAGADVLSGFISDNGEVGAHCKSWYSSIVVYDNTWHQVGMVFDAGTFELVIDGAFDPSPTKTIDVAITTIHLGTAPTCIGTAMHIGAPMWEFDGQIVLPRIYTWALSAGKIKQHFEAERHFFGV
ncbi:hypothetical protein ES703_47204 [subsurface metagenome]